MRVQFGRPIGQFQAVKHAARPTCWCPSSSAPRWPGTPQQRGVRPGTAPTRALSAGIAGAVALDAAARCAKQCIQILGGIGFTWEHDAHLYLKRAMANLQLVAGGDVGALEHEVTALAVGGARRNLAADLPAEADALRDEIRAVVTDIVGVGASGGDQRRRTDGGGPDHAALAATVGPGRLTARAARDRRGAGRGGRGPPAPRRRRMGAADVDRGRDPRAAGALGAPHAARDVELVPAVQRARRRLGPGRPQHEGGARRRRLEAQRAEGVDVVGPDRRLRHLSRPLRPGRAEARRHHVLHRRHARRGHRHSAVARAHGRRHVQRGLLQRRLRPRRRGGGHPRGRLAHRPHHAGQRARLHVVGRVLRQRGGIAHPQRGPAPPTRPRRARRASRGAWAT